MPLSREFLAQIAREKELSLGETQALIELFGSNKSRQEVADSLHISDSALSTRLGKIYGKFAIKGSGPVKLQKLQDYLIEQFQKWKPAGNTQQDEAASDIDTLVQAVREQIRPLIKERCGTMKVLDMTQAIALTGEQGIYTNVNILEKITGRRRLGLEELLQGCDLEEFDRFNFSRVTEERVPGLEAVQRHSKLMVLGKPGAGKTTFLKYLAMQCVEGNFQAERVPIFITLKDFAEANDQPDILSFISRLTGRHPIEVNNRALPLQDENLILHILEQGRALVLLDGLDEVREEDTKRVLRYIREFSNQFYSNQFVATCRIAAKEYTFENFTEVEVADFNKEQIVIFVNNWFGAKFDPVKSSRFLQKLQDNKPIQELASNPLLLTLLCLMFEESADFPANRAELYKEGLDVLLKKWDTKRNIERDQIYRNLSFQRKEDLLSQIALITFEKKDYFFKQKTVESYISDFIRNLYIDEPTQKDLELDSEGILKSIEAQHGLLAERAKGIYSFSHLTFHEYFAAREINAVSMYDKLAQHITEKRWREVFLLTVGMMRKADSLLQAIKREVDNIIAGDTKLQKFLCWVYERSVLIKPLYKEAAVRACYLTSEISLRNRLDNNLASDSSYIFNLQDSFEIQKFNNRDYNLFLDIIIIETLELGISLTNSRAIGLDNIPSLAISRACQLTHSSKLRKELKQIRSLLPSLDSCKAASEKWWKCSGSDWIKEFRDLSIKYRNIGFNWEFSEEQEELLHEYYDANKLLVDCLNSDCYVSREVRQEIEDTLLLPIAEIEKYKAAKASQ